MVILMVLIRNLSIKLLNFAQRLNDWCYKHDDGRNFDRILELQLRINELKVEANLFNDDEYLQ